jgi:protoporphyrinogen oxidase
MTSKTDIVCIGGGPAGLTAAYLLSKEGKSVTVLESDPEYVGGISRTVDFKGFKFDIGGHRFFSKSPEVNQLWKELLPNDFLTRPRSSRIFYNKKFFSYPLKAFEALLNLGIFQSILCVMSYFVAKISPVRNPKSFEDWVTNQFGSRLFKIFFKTYTEKVWGMSCRDISADWAAQRIKGLSLGTAILNALTPKLPKTSESQSIKSLIETFQYPRLGPGMMWEAAAEKTRALGGQIQLGCHVNKLYYDHRANSWTVSFLDKKTDTIQEVTCKHIISSAPLNSIINATVPTPKSALNAKNLKYRDFITVALIVKDSNESFSDNWIYIHEPNVKVGRIQNFKSWSPDLIPDPALNCYGLEYFCFENDGLWASSDVTLIELAKKELVQLNLARPEHIIDGTVVRQAKAYPIYDEAYQTHVEEIRSDLQKNYPGLHIVGRNGMHKYNNQDHAMMTSMLTVKNILAGRMIHNIWNVNQDAEYHEESTETSTNDFGLRQVPVRAA